jgi:tetratricopeptide (TPR) repeat protein
VAGDAKRAAQLLTNAVSANPKLPAADWLVLALAHAKLKEIDQAKKASGKALELLSPSGAVAGLRPLLREVIRALGTDSPEANALIAALAGKAPAALTDAIRRNPDKAKGYRDRGNWFAERGLWKEAIADFTEDFRREPDSYIGLRLGIYLIQTGQIDRYRAHCQAMLDKWGSTEKIDDANRTLKTVLLLPDFQGDAKQLARLAAVSVSGGKNVNLYEWKLLTKGLYEYRAGKYADAVATCREIQLRAPNSAGDRQALSELRLAIEAMALHRSGDEAGAKRALAEAKSSLAIHLPGIDLDVLTHDWLTVQMLYREAEGLISGKKAEQPK